MQVLSSQLSLVHVGSRDYLAHDAARVHVQTPHENDLDKAMCAL